MRTWFGLFTPAGTPKEILVRLHQEVVKALGDAKVKERLANRGFDVTASTPEAFATFLQVESESAGRLVRSAGIKPE